MPENLVIVESPAKAKTIKKYLGKDFEVLASYGHVRDLVPKEGAVDPSRRFAMKYDVLEKNERHVDAISRALRKASALYLATDPDREGEAISWHLKEILEGRGDLDGKQVHRVVFYEITRNAIRAAIGEPRELSMDLVNAQQARRALDYLVGFNLSPLLWKKVRRGLSAGRVQSPALRMICEREAEIQAFVPREYWSLEAEGEHSQQKFPLRLIEYRGAKVEQFTFTGEAQAREVERTLRVAAGGAGEAPAGTGGGALRVLAIDRKQRRRNPAPPFTTSTLQQEAARKLGFSAQRTMRLAQQLYEGVDYGEGAVGLITYMRTDSVNLANEAVTEIREVIARLYGAESVAEEVRVYKTKSRNAQEAHEAVRPTSAAITPQLLEGRIDPDQHRLYALIWKRAVACQMAHAVFDTVAVDLLAGPDGPQRHLLRANGSTLVKPGYIAVYQEGHDDSADDDSDHVLPAMQEGDAVALLGVHGEQHFTEPPPRYSEASLVKALEEHGIGRPSTYASIISTLRDREYVDMDNRRFIPTDIGKIVNGFLSKHFHKYVEYGFTAAMEDELDAVSRGEEDWTQPLKNFWKPFIDLVEHTEKNVSREEVAQARELGTDPASGKPVSVRMGRFGPFVQIGTKDDAEKPRFAGLRPGQKMDKITLDEALYLFLLPRKLGATPEGEPVEANVGRFGPYVKYGSKYASLKEDDPYTITLERALEVIRAKQIADANRIIQDFGVDNIQVLNGRYGPYITDKTRNARIPKDRDPKTLTLEECRELLAAAPVRPQRGGRGRGGRGGFARGAGGARGAAGGPAAAKSGASAAAKAGGDAAPAVAAAATAAAAPTPKAAKAPAKRKAASPKAKAAGANGSGKAGTPAKRKPARSTDRPLPRAPRPRLRASPAGEIPAQLPRRQFRGRAQARHPGRAARGARAQGQGFLFLDTHAGRGAYDLGSAAARQGGESEGGIERLLETLSSGAAAPAPSPHDSPPPAPHRDASTAPDGSEAGRSADPLGHYVSIVRAFRRESGQRHAYPGSPLIAAAMLRPQDRAVLIEAQAEEHAELRRALRMSPTAPRSA
ncbi:MAG: DNA topoisomerase I [Steroidobacteraceae bacterium]